MRVCCWSIGASTSPTSPPPTRRGPTSLPRSVPPIDTVVRQLMSGKEAMVFVVRSGAEVRCAKVYKEADKRSFRQAVDYTENRKTRNSRAARAMAKGTRFGREVQEAAWQSAEVSALYRLAAAGVRAHVVCRHRARRSLRIQHPGRRRRPRDHRGCRRWSRAHASTPLECRGCSCHLTRDAGRGRPATASCPLRGRRSGAAARSGIALR